MDSPSTWRNKSFCGLVVSSGFVALNACARSAVCSVFQPCETQERYDVHTPPAIAIELHNAKRFQQRFQLQKGFIFGVCPPIRQYVTRRMINCPPQPALWMFGLHETPHLVYFGFHLAIVCQAESNYCLGRFQRC